MKNLKIGTRITIGFAALILITVALSAFSFERLSRISSNAHDVVGNFLPSIYAMGQIESNARENGRLTMRHIVSVDAKDMSEIESRMQVNREQNNKIFKSYDALIADAHEKELFSDILAARSAYNAISPDVLALSRDRKSVV